MNGRSLWAVAAALATCFGSPAGAQAADAAAEPTKTIDERISDLEKSLGALADFGLSGMVYASYLFNFNEPDNRTNSLRSLDQDHNSLTLDLFQLGITKTGPAGLSFASKLDFGKTASRIGADWKGDGEFDGITNSGGDFELEEAYVTYAPEWAHGGSLKLGKFVTLLGAEVIESPSNMNYSRSFLFGFAIPFTHTGVLFGVPLSEHVTTNIGVVNGWDNVADNNDGKTLLGNVGWTASPNFSLLVAGTYGPEQSDTSSNSRGVADVVSTITLDPLTILLNGDYGHENSAALDGGSEKWYGFSGILGLALKDLTGVPAGAYLRGEVFRDDGGARTGTDQTLWEITLTGKYFVTEKLTLWAEYRHDGSDEDAFAKSGSIVTSDPTSGETSTSPRFKDLQDTVSIAASYVF
ncbi:MAG: porin [Deltaproteobacteria bacterium]|nr:porin [Deltaproteobacteria bacterium]